MPKDKQPKPKHLHIIEALRPFAVPIDSLSIDPANVRLHSERNIDTIKGSLARFGQQKPIVVDAANVVVAGNGTVLAAKALGWTHIAAVDTPLTGPERTAFAMSAVATNQVQPGMAYAGNRIRTPQTSLTGHPAVFPAGLPCFFMAAFSDPGDSWLDPFLGSGTTLVAAEQLGRTGYGMEIAPEYVAVTLERLADMGLKPKLLSREEAVT